MKEKYMKPSIEITVFESVDIICTSAEIANPDFAPDVDMGSAYHSVDVFK